MNLAQRVELADARRMRTRNTMPYRVLHWPLWIFVFFLAPGPLTFDLFAGRANRWNLFWLLLVLLGTGIAGLRGCLPGAEPAPYILRFTEDRPNPLYRRVCYTFAWNAAVNFALMNLVGAIFAVATGRWVMQPIYRQLYLPVFMLIVLLGAFAQLPRTRLSTRGEGTERRYFYGTVWAVTLGQTALLLLWKTLPRTHGADALKLAVYLGVMAVVVAAAARGVLPRTRPIVPGERMVAD